MRESARSSNGMIATPHYLATEAGLQVLREGGSGVDACIAANAALTVLYPDQTSVGGDCFFLIWDPRQHKVFGWNGSGPAPMTASAEYLRNNGWNAMPRRGVYPITVPGTVDAWFAVHDSYGRTEMSRLLQPAADLARDGFPISPRLAGAIASQEGVLRDLPYVGEVMLPGGRVPGAGDILAFPKLAHSLERIGNEGRDLFYTGEIGERIASHVQDLGGWLSEDDLAQYGGEWVEPISVDYRDAHVVGFPPNSQGITSLLGLGMLNQESMQSTWGAAEDVHAQVEAKQRAFRIRDSQIADPRFVDIDTDALLSADFLADLWSDFDPWRAVPGADPLIGDTVYLCAVDADGMAVSMIQSMYQAFGSGIADAETGIILHNRGSYFSLNPERVNVLEPGKRPLHTLMPAMLLRDGDLMGPFGTQGGDVQAQVHIQLASSVVDFGLQPQDAIDRPRWITGDPGEVLLEEGFEGSTISGLAQRGHQVTVIAGWNGGTGHAQMILRDPDSGELLGGADPRADGLASGY